MMLADHDQFKELDFEAIKENMKCPIIFDTKNILKTADDDITLINFGNLYKFIH